MVMVAFHTRRRKFQLSLDHFEIYIDKKVTSSFNILINKRNVCWLCFLWGHNKDGGKLVSILKWLQSVHKFGVEVIAFQGLSLKKKKRIQPTLKLFEKKWIYLDTFSSII